MRTLAISRALGVMLGLALLPVGLSATPADEPQGPLKVALLSGAEEYQSDDSLAKLAAYLEQNFSARCTLVKAKGETDLPGLEALDDCDVALFFTRRLKIDGPQLEKIKQYVASKKPIVGVRTASHGFQNWLEFDKLVLGGNYQNHFRNDLSQRVIIEPKQRDHDVLKGVDTLASRGSLYKTSPVADDVKVLMTGTSPEGKEPSAWVRERDGRRVFYTALGAIDDFENRSFLRLLANGLFWAAGRSIPDLPTPADPPLRPKQDGDITLTLRTRVEPFKGSGQWEDVTLTRTVPAAETAIILCDMWDRHWCRGATERCDAIAARMAPVVAAARARGVQIIHAPSECMGFYAGTPQRLRMQRAPLAQPPAPPTLPTEPKLPIDDSDGGCDTDDAMYLAWTRQNAKIDIGPYDGISDNGQEVYNLCRQLGIKNVIVMGVHTNMCVLGRSFAIREMTRRGLSCVLVRDLTDTMYDPKDAPKVPHDRGTELVVEHIEKYWCPSTTASELTQGLPQ